MKSENKNKGAESIIRNHMIWSMGAGVIPVPFVDFLAVTAIQLDMVKQLSSLYDLDFNKTKGKAVITALTSSSIAKMAAGRMVKFIPVVGSVIGGVTMSVMSGATTYAIGEVFRRHFETGGTFLDFDPARLKKYYDEKFEKGKEYAEKIREEQDKVEEVKDTTVIMEKLKELGQMKKDGIITEEEFSKMKAKLIGE
jgi:uncharacterized protein (DUF697 family)